VAFAPWTRAELCDGIRGGEQGQHHHHRVVHTGYLRITIEDGVVTWWLKGKPFTATPPR
jgi:hypothetical protein